MSNDNRENERELGTGFIRDQGPEIEIPVDRSFNEEQIDEESKPLNHSIKMMFFSNIELLQFSRIPLFRRKNPKIQAFLWKFGPPTLFP